VGPALLAILFSLLSTIMSAYQILAGGKRALWLADVSPGIGETLFRIVKGTYPDIGWATTLAALIWLYISVTPSEKHIMPIESRNCVPKGEFASSDSPPQAASS
jgi:hypothetical protein